LARNSVVFFILGLDPIMQNPAIDIYGIGQCALDYLGIIDNYPPANSKCEFHNLIVQGGGPVATALVALQRWGFTTAFSGVLGDDEYGRQILNSISGEGVDISNVKVRRNTGSQVAFSMAEPTSGERTIFWRRPTGAYLTENEIDYDLIQNCRLVHTDGFFPEAALAAAKHAKSSGIPVCIDAGSLRPGMLELARHCNYFITGEPFARSFAEDAKPEDVCYKLKALGPDVVAVTLGDKGYVALFENRLVHGSAYHVDTIDTTGCGDIFHAGFIYGILHEWPFAACFDFAAWAAAQVSRHLGGRTGIPDKAGIVNYKKNIKK
jgi:ribokinase